MLRRFLVLGIVLTGACGDPAGPDGGAHVRLRFFHAAPQLPALTLIPWSHQEQDYLPAGAVFEHLTPGALEEGIVVPRGDYYLELRDAVMDTFLVRIPLDTERSLPWDTTTQIVLTYGIGYDLDSDGEPCPDDRVGSLECSVSWAYLLPFHDPFMPYDPAFGNLYIYPLSTRTGQGDYELWRGSQRIRSGRVSSYMKLMSAEALLDPGSYSLRILPDDPSAPTLEQILDIGAARRVAVVLHDALAGGTGLRVLDDPYPAEMPPRD